jgi:FtsH-binding integral membrane protein
MSRPRQAYLVAVWWWISCSIAASRGINRLAANADQVAEATPSYLATIMSLLPTVAVALIIWELVAIIQMRPKAYLVLRVFLGLWTAMIISRFYWIMSGSAQTALFAAAVASINVLVLFYVSRTEYRSACVAFREYKERERARKFAEKQFKKIGKK